VWGRLCAYRPSPNNAVVSTAISTGGAGSGKVKIWAASLTGAAMISVVVAFFGGTSTSGARLTPGCGGGIGLLFVALFILALVFGLIGVVAVVGAILLWFRYQWGVLTLIAVNLLSLYLIAGSQSVYPGQLVWGVVVVLLAAIPLIAIGVLLWPLWTRGNKLVLALQLLILGALAVPVVLTAGPGLATEVNSALQAPPAPQTATQTHSGCGATTGFIVSPERE
jgi:hypothetical protein